MLKANFVFTVEIITSAVAGVSTATCVVLLLSMLYFKMYRHGFTYRLIHYTLFATTALSLCVMIAMLLNIRVSDNQRSAGVLNGTVLNSDNNVTIFAVVYVYNSSEITVCLLTTCVSFSIYNLAVQNYQFKSLVPDLNCLLVSLITPHIITLILVSICDGNVSPGWRCRDRTDGYEESVIVIFVAVLVAVNGVFMFTTLVVLCCRASKCNTIAMNTATTASNRQALKETIPLLLIPTSSLVYVLYVIIVNYLTPMLSFIGLNLTASSSADFFVGNFLPSTFGLVFSSLFAVHLCFLGSRKLKKLRGVKRIRYGTMGHTHRPTTVFTSEGLSETCNTDYPHVSS